MYALRVAVLSYAISTAGSEGSSSTNTAATAATSTTPGAGGAGGATVSASSLSRPTLRQSVTSSTSSAFSRPADGWSGLFSLSSSSSSPSKVKFPKEFPKVLEGRMIKIFQGHDSAHSDQLFRASVGAFFGVYKDKSFQAKLVQNRQIEEIILAFVTTASGLLRKRLPEGDEWKARLNEQVSEFVKVVRDSLRSCKNVLPELLQRLESYVSKLIPPPTSSRSSLSPSAASSSPSPYGDASSAASTSKVTLDQPHPSVSGMATNVQEMPLALAVGRLFGKNEAELTRDVVSLRRSCTEQVG